MPEQLPVWKTIGIEPPVDLKENGWQPGMKPSAQHMNWLFNRAYKCIEELQGDSAKITELQQTLATLEQTVTSNDTKINEHLTEHLRIEICVAPPENPNSKTFWLEDLGESIDFVLGSGLLIGNASTDGSNDVWFDENV